MSTEFTTSPKIPGPWHCQGSLGRLARFLDLIRHHRRFATQIRFARPLTELIGMEREDPGSSEIIKREINRLIPLVTQDLRLGAVSASVVRRTATLE